MEVCRLRDTPIMTFINKLIARAARHRLLDEVESVLKIRTAPVTWPIGMGAISRHLPPARDKIYVYEAAGRGERGSNRVIRGCTAPMVANSSATAAAASTTRSSWCAGHRPNSDVDDYLRRQCRPRCLRLGDLDKFRRGGDVLAHFAVHAPRRARARHRAARSRVGRGQAHLASCS
jgi:peptide chain release factor 3